MIVYLPPNDIFFRGMKLERIDDFYDQHAYLLGMAACFCLPLKLTWAYFFLVPLLLLWLVHQRFRFAPALVCGAEVLMPFVFFLFIALLGAPLSIDPLRSLDKLSGLFFFGLTILAFRDLALTYDFERLLFALVSGQCVAAIHSILEGALGALVPRIFLGAVTESGQLAMSILLTLGIMTVHARDKARSDGRRASLENRASLLGMANFCACTLLAFSPLAASPAWRFWGALVLAGALLALTIWRQRAVRLGDPQGDLRIFHILTTLVLPLLLGALLVNLKRGPWMGIIVGGLLFLFLERRKLALPMLVITATLLLSVKPIQDRLAHSDEHFFISGGRSEIWDIGAELAVRYPLGVGYRNSGFLRKFSEHVPKELNHFHNNVLNVLVETGWLGLMAYLWWLLAMLKSAFSQRGSPRAQILSRSLGCAIISWQTAGIVEYNFGDSEVVLIAFICAGMISALSLSASQSTERSLQAA